MKKNTFPITSFDEVLRRLMPQKRAPDRVRIYREYLRQHSPDLDPGEHMKQIKANMSEVEERDFNGLKEIFDTWHKRHVSKARKDAAKHRWESE